MDENWQQLKEIFADALRQKPGDRPDFVLQRCNGDRNLQLEIESLLSSYDSAELFMESPAVGEVAETFVADCRKLKDDDFLNHYRIIRKIGTGGMGEVYLAEDTILERFVAIKILNNTFDSGQSSVKRFFQEAKAASALNHPNIITVYELGECDGDHFIATEFVKGDTLNIAVKRENLSLIQIINISIQIVNALAAAHEVGIIHRDIKPENIMLRADGVVKILDFGLAKLTKKRESDIDLSAGSPENLKTHTGAILGTAAYMSPEQTRGKNVDARTDIWSFGVLLFQLVSQKLPFQGDTTSDIIAAILKSAPPSAADFVSDIPAELEFIISKTLRKDPNERYRTARELLDDLKDFQRKLEFEEKTEPLEFRVSENPRQNANTNPEYVNTTTGNFESINSFVSRALGNARISPTFTLLGLLTLAALIVGGYTISPRLSPLVNQTDSFQNMRLTKLTYEGLAGDLAAISPDGRYVVYVVQDKGKESLALRQTATSGVVQIVPPADVEYAGLTFTPDGDYIYYTVGEENQNSALYKISVLGGDSRKIIDNADGQVIFSPDGNEIAFRRGETALMIASADGDSLRQLATFSQDKVWNRLAWNPDGKTITGSFRSPADGKYHLVEISLKDGSEKSLSDTAWLRINGLTWLKDGNGIIITGRDLKTKYSQIWLLSFPNGEPRRITNDFSNYIGASLTADDKSLAVVKEERLSNIWIADGANETPRKITSDEGKDEGMSGVMWTPDGRIIYTVRPTGTIDLWIMNADGTDKRQLTFNQGSNFNPTISPDGRSIVFVSDRTGNLEIWEMNIDSSNPHALTNTPELEGYPSFTPDGKWIVYQRTDVQNHTTIWKLNMDGGTSVQLTKTGAGRPTVSPDGGLFACDYGEIQPDNPNKIAIFSIEGGEPLKILNSPRVVKSRTFRWTPDGKALIYIDDRDLSSNLWSQTLDERPPQQLTFFKSDQTTRFDLNRDGKSFVMARGNESSDVVIISNFR